MTEEKKQPQQHGGHRGGLLHMQVKRFFSDVASAGQAVLKEAQVMQAVEQKKQSSCKPPTAGSSPRKPNLPPEIERQERGKDNITKEKDTQQKTKTFPSPVKLQTPRLVSQTAVVEMPKEVISQTAIVISETEWELLSTEDRASKTSNGSFVACPRVGSVRSITSVDHESSSHTELSVPFKIQKTNSSSTLDSQDNTIGPSGKGVLGVDYVEHVVLPTDTLQGICIAYKVSATHLRRANHFSGNLHSAPKKLVIPISKQALRAGFIRVQDTDTKEYKLHYFQAEFPDITSTEAKAYLELVDWDLKDAIQSVREDREWETENNEGEEDDEGGLHRKKETHLKSGQIGIKVIDFRGGIPIFNLKGTGFPTLSDLKKSGSDDSSSSESNSMSKKEKIGRKNKVVIHKRPPAIATKSVLPQDLYEAAPQHGAFGFELQEIQKR
ncbi:hypothetical protein IV203_037605 [Nitzschia inconspicua]|uniref:LysM domain-containing protein n=1 Tax=Nitzschia inconspicua TaxID=303405 RepID=A0A9K3LL97_9STRA|nr:hypothetical protein IV203_037605 [Nitzschia inconspicua]